MVRPTLRTKSVTTKLTEEEVVRLEELAGAAGQTMSEWVREILLRKVEELQARPAEYVIVGEVLALRTILLNLLFKVTNEERITAEEMRQLISCADAEKNRKARERLDEAVDVKSQTT